MGSLEGAQNLTQAPAVLLLLPLLLVHRCVDPYEPEHNSQMLLYAAMNSGELALAERYADASVRFPATYGPMNMADGESFCFVWPARAGCMAGKHAMVCVVL